MRRPAAVLLLASPPALLQPAWTPRVCDLSILGTHLAPCVSLLPSPLPAGSYNQIMLKSPVLLESELDAVRGDSALQAQTFSLHFTAGRPTALQEAVAGLCKQVGGRRSGGGGAQ